MIWAPLSIHLLASTLKRSYITYRTRRAPILSIHIITGWVLIPFLLPHILSHRLIPASPAPTINTLWPSEWGFEFVSYALNSRPISSGLGYIALVGLAVPHALLGGMKIVSWIKRLRGTGEPNIKSTPVVSKETLQQPMTDASSNTGTPSSTEPSKPSLETPRRLVIPRGRKDIAGKALATLLAVIAIGLVRLRSDGLHVGRFMSLRYEAVLKRTAWTRLWLS